MSQAACISESLTVDLARECLYRFFAAALSDPRGPGGRILSDADERRLAAAAADVLRDEARLDPVPLGFGEQSSDDLDLTDLIADLEHSREATIRDYDRVFGLVTIRECPPYETEYCSTEDPFLRAQQLADVAGFYAAFGLRGGRERPDRPDHVALELEFMAHLLLKKRLADDGTSEGSERAQICADAAQRFFRDHLAWWAPSFASGLRSRSNDGFYAKIARMLAAFLPTERCRYGVKTPRAPVRPAGYEHSEESSSCGECPLGG